MSIKTFRRQSVFQQLFSAGRSKRRVLCLKRKKNPLQKADTHSSVGILPSWMKTESSRESETYLTLRTIPWNPNFAIRRVRRSEARSGCYSSSPCSRMRRAISYGKKKKYFCCGHSRIVYAAKFVCRPYGRRAYSIGGKSRFKFGRHIFRSRQFGRSYDGRG